MNVGAIILAGGASKRLGLGYPKQLLPLENTTLLARVVEAVYSAIGHYPITITGCYHRELVENHSLLPTVFQYNQNWELGVSTSIRLGMIHLASQSDRDAALIVVADQPCLEPDTIRGLMRAARRAHFHHIVCSRYSSQSNHFGPPCLFKRVVWPELMSLTGDQGAKSIIKSSKDRTIWVPFEKGLIDIDTWQDYLNSKSDSHVLVKGEKRHRI